MDIIKDHTYLTNSSIYLVSVDACQSCHGQCGDLHSWVVKDHQLALYCYGLLAFPDYLGETYLQVYNGVGDVCGCRLVVADQRVRKGEWGGGGVRG